jgi:hypothetical protein
MRMRETAAGPGRPVAHFVLALTWLSWNPGSQEGNARGSYVNLAQPPPGRDQGVTRARLILGLFAVFIAETRYIPHLGGNVYCARSTAGAA